MKQVLAGRERKNFFSSNTLSFVACQRVFKLNTRKGLENIPCPSDDQEESLAEEAMRPMFLISLSFMTLTGIIQISCCKTCYKVLVENAEIGFQNAWRIINWGRQL